MLKSRYNYVIFPGKGMSRFPDKAGMGNEETIFRYSYVTGAAVSVYVEINTCMKPKLYG